MSHFSVLVIGDDVAKQMAPFHEFECTGDDDEYVVDVDKTEEAREEYRKDTSPQYQDPDGNLHYAYDDKFYRDPTPEEMEKHKPMGTGFGSGISWTSKDWGDGRGYRPKIHFMPEGWTKTKIPTAEVYSFADWASEFYGRDVLKPGEPKTEDHKYGYILVDEKGDVVKVIKRTNPNAKWDSWRIGGRWGGNLKLKAGKVGVSGSRGLFSPDPVKGHADQVCKGDLDLKGMRKAAAKEAAEKYDFVYSMIHDTPVNESWDSVWNRIAESEGAEAARKFYGEQPRVVAFEKKCNQGPFSSVDAFNVDRETYIKQAVDSAHHVFAIVKDGQWYERGEMGWFGVVTDEKDRNEWNTFVNDLLDGLADDTLLTIVDCHI